MTSPHQSSVRLQSGRTCGAALLRETKHGSAYGRTMRCRRHPRRKLAVRLMMPREVRRKDKVNRHCSKIRVLWCLSRRGANRITTCAGGGVATIPQNKTDRNKHNIALQNKSRGPDCPHRHSFHDICPGVITQREHVRGVEVFKHLRTQPACMHA